MKLNTTDNDLEYYGDPAHVGDVIARMSDQDARAELLTAIEAAGAEGDVVISAAALDAFMASVAAMVAE